MKIKAIFIELHFGSKKYYPPLLHKTKLNDYHEIRRVKEATFKIALLIHIWTVFDLQDFENLIDAFGRFKIPLKFEWWFRIVMSIESIAFESVEAIGIIVWRVFHFAENLLCLRVKMCVSYEISIP